MGGVVEVLLCFCRGFAPIFSNLNKSCKFLASFKENFSGVQLNLLSILELNNSLLMEMHTSHMPFQTLIFPINAYDQIIDTVA